MAETTSASTFTVERSATISASPAAIFERIVDFHRWLDWSPWEGIDPALQRTYTGPDSGVGAAYAWQGNRKVGSGRMEITSVDEPSRVEIRLEFIKPFKATNTTVFAITPSGDGSKVVWTMTGKKTLATKVMGIFTSMDKFVGRDFEKGLAQLQAAAES